LCGEGITAAGDCGSGSFTVILFVTLAVMFFDELSVDVSPTGRFALSASHGFSKPRNHCGFRRLDGGAEGIRTDGHRTMPLVRSESVAEYGAVTANPAFPLFVHAESDPRV
jgi:hypothetical protein